VSYPKREFNSTRSSSVQGLVGNYDITDNDLRSTFPNVENLADVEYLHTSVLTIAAVDDIIRKPKVLASPATAHSRNTQHWGYVYNAVILPMTLI
jgi:hypothetical protein